MWQYEKKLQFPVNIKNRNPKYAQIIISQYGGPDGELGASMRYLTQRYGQPFSEVKGILTDIGTEELAHLEMVCAMVHQLTRDLTPEEIKQSGFDKYFVDHTASVYPQAAAGIPWRAEYIQSKGDVLADLHEDLAAEQKARVTYDNLIRLIDDPDILEPLKFLRQREITHYQRFGEAEQSIWNDYGGVADKPLEIKKNRTLIHSATNQQPCFNSVKKAGLLSIRKEKCENKRKYCRKNVQI